MRWRRWRRSSFPPVRSTPGKAARRLVCRVPCNRVRRCRADPLGRSGRSCGRVVSRRRLRLAGSVGVDTDQDLTRRGLRSRQRAVPTTPCQLAQAQPVPAWPGWTLSPAASTRASRHISNRLGSNKLPGSGNASTSPAPLSRINESVGKQAMHSTRRWAQAKSRKRRRLLATHQFAGTRKPHRPFRQGTGKSISRRE